MNNTKDFLLTMGAIALLICWLLVHALFWRQVVDSVVWGTLCYLATSIVLPGLAITLYLDLTAGWRR